SSYINIAKDQIMNIANAINDKKEIKQIRFALVCYRDHPPEDKTYVTKTFQFTSDIKKMKKNVDTAKAEGGGDGPEAVADGLNELLGLDWFSDAVKIAIFIADAPPHGLIARDRWKKCPKGHDPIKVAYKCAARGIIIYSVACEPSISSTPPTGDFMKAVAEITEGRYVPLAGAHLLPKIILGAADEEADLEALLAEVEKEVDQIRAASSTPIAEEEIAGMVQDRLSSKGITTAQMEIGELNMPEVKFSSHFVEAKSLEEASASYPKEMTDYIATSSLGYVGCEECEEEAYVGEMMRSAPIGGVPAAAGSPATEMKQEIKMKREKVSSEQVKKMLGRIDKRKK
ncbi:MAG: hypothetical protein ACFFCS_14660, partial [Candidatus Hodarchaeota archaeon]